MSIFIIIGCSYKWLYDTRIVTFAYEFKESLYQITQL